MTVLLIAAGVVATGVALYLLHLILRAAGTSRNRRLDLLTARCRAGAPTRVVHRLDLTGQVRVIGHGDDDAPGGAGRYPDLARTTVVPPAMAALSGSVPDSWTRQHARAAPLAQAIGPQGQWIEAAPPSYLRQHP
ncbi:MAG TPA: hypothetical protein VFX16_08435 [Pseudonocardiaceae bacterium]|nr:hypothetical protein [Pseudonocardiaceae bacterium]